MYRTGCNAYQHSASNTVEDKNLILLKLYDGAIRFLNRAQQGIETHQVNVRGEGISKAMAIITELDCALDMDKGGQLAQQLASLYRYVMNRLTTANSKSDLNALIDAQNILATLKEGFEGAVQQQLPKKAPVAAQPTTTQPVFEETLPREGLRYAV